jgi:hypothetical protein
MPVDKGFRNNQFPSATDCVVWELKFKILFSGRVIL